MSCKIVFPVDLLRRRRRCAAVAAAVLRGLAVSGAGSLGPPRGGCSGGPEEEWNKSLGASWARGEPWKFSWDLPWKEPKRLSKGNSFKDTYLPLEGTEMQKRGAQLYQQICQNHLFWTLLNNIISYVTCTGCRSPFSSIFLISNYLIWIFCTHIRQCYIMLTHSQLM